MKFSFLSFSFTTITADAEPLGVLNTSTNMYIFLELHSALVRAGKKQYNSYFLTPIFDNLFNYYLSRFAKSSSSLITHSSIINRKQHAGGVDGRQVGSRARAGWWCSGWPSTAARSTWCTHRPVGSPPSRDAAVTASCGGGHTSDLRK